MANFGWSPPKILGHGPPMVEACSRSVAIYIFVRGCAPEHFPLAHMPRLAADTV